MSFISILILFTLTACEKVLQWDIEKEEINTIVVNGMITNEFKQHEIQITLPKTDMNSEAKPVKDAEVILSRGNARSRFLPSEQEEGVYISEIPFTAGLNRAYQLEITTQSGQQYTASSNMVPLFPYNLPDFRYHEQINRYSINWNNAQYDPLEQAMYEAIIDWSHLTSNDTINTRARLLYYTLNTINVSHILFPSDQQIVVFPEGSRVIFSKYSINDEQATYIRAFLSETQWQGSIFEPDRGNLPGNISNGGLGFFSVNAVSRDTLFVKGTNTFNQKPDNQ